jgi:hypothetical protein
MDQVVPGVLQRLRAADIIRVAGLAVAAMGQEYSRAGAVRDTERRGTRLSGIVSVPDLANSGPAGTGEASAALNGTEARHYLVEVDVLQADRWQVRCSCDPARQTPCEHAAALLYRWLADPPAFVAPDDPVTPPLRTEQVATAARGAPERATRAAREERRPTKAKAASGRGASPFTLRGPMPLGSLADLLSQLPLNELRSIAREYQVSSQALNRQQLVEAIQAAYQQPATVQRVVSRLEKPQRQLLAALCLAGGSLTDEDVRGLFERFAIGYANQLQAMLSALQKKGLVFRTNLHGTAPTQRFAAVGSLLDVGPGWYVPPAISAALHITVPLAHFDLDEAAKEGRRLRVLSARPSELLARLLLIARALDRSTLDTSEEAARQEALNAAGGDGTTDLPPPPEWPSAKVIAALQSAVEQPPAFLRFAIRLLRLADILYRDDEGGPYLRVLSNAAALLLGPGRAEVLSDLFHLWAKQRSYDELYDLGESGLHLRCRSLPMLAATPLYATPFLPGEVASENCEARQTVLALLAQVPVEKWVSFVAFARFLYRLSPTFLQRQHSKFSATRWWIEQEGGRPLRPTQLQDWMRAEGRYLAALLRGPLHWFGLCDVAVDQQSELLAFRLTPLAALLLGGVTPQTLSWPDDQAPSGPLLEVQPENTILVRAAAEAWPVLEVLEACAEAEGVAAGRLRYRLTPRAFCQARRRGAPLEQLLELLRREMAGGQQPASQSALEDLLTTLERWCGSYGELRLYSGVNLLQGADPVVMRELSLTTSIDAHVVYALLPTLLILDDRGGEVVVEELRRRGQLPLLHEEETNEAE